MRVLICGDRNWKDSELIERIILSFPKDTVIIQGMCRGADLMARTAAIKHGYEYEDYPADWDFYGPAAGPIRNKQILEEGKPDIVFAFHPNILHSKGTRNMIRQATKAGVKVKLINGEMKCAHCGSKFGGWTSIYDWRCYDCEKVTLG